MQKQCIDKIVTKNVANKSRFLKYVILLFIVFSVVLFQVLYEICSTEVQELGSSIVTSNYNKWGHLVNEVYDDDDLVNWKPAPKLHSDPNEVGYLGEAVVLSPEFVTLANLRYREHEMNIVASEMIPYNRTIRDIRLPECLHLKYPEKLPQTSIVIAFHNEAWSTLIRTLWSIYTKSPRELIKEIIMVDDKSTHKYLGQKLEQYIKQIPLSIRIVRCKERSGLIQAKSLGAKHATASVITFIDAHCECNDGWLEPLLFRIAENRQAVVVPVVDYINPDTMEVKNIRDMDNLYGAFSWDLWFGWYYIPERERKRVNFNRTAPLNTPCMVGGIFSIDREYYFEVGAYDDEMVYYGGENIETTIRIWTCGGQVETIPCSRVAHIEKHRKPYTTPNGLGYVNTQNCVRVVDVWFDEYKAIYYALNPLARHVQTDTSKRAELRRRLQCRPFKWFLDNIFPESSLFEKYYAVGSIENLGRSSMCLYVHSGLQIGVLRCNNFSGDQVFMLTEANEIRKDKACVTFNKDNAFVDLKFCNKFHTQEFAYNNQTKAFIYNNSTNCLTLQEKKLILQTCNELPSQQWKINNFLNETKLV